MSQEAMKYEDIKDFNQRCEEHPDHQTGMISERMIQARLSEEIDELRAYIEAKQEQHMLSSRVNDVRVHIEHGKQHDEAMKRITTMQEQGEPVGRCAVYPLRGDESIARHYIEWVNGPISGDLYTTPQPKQEPMAMQMDVIVVNLVREGINKHRARELAEHFIKHTTPQQRTWVELTAEDRELIQKWTKYTAFMTPYEYAEAVQIATEAKLKEKNT